MGTVLFHPYAIDGGSRDETWEALAGIRRMGSVAVLDAPCDDWGDYTRWLATLWGQGQQLLVLEHDLVPTPWALAGLLGCRAPICAQAYRAYPPTTGRVAPVYAHCQFDGHSMLPVEEGQEYADDFALGFTMLRRPFQGQTAVQRWGASTWQNLSVVLSQEARRVGMRAHLHWPAVEHLHQ